MTQHPPDPKDPPDPDVSCPACQTGMQRQMLHGHYGTSVTIDLCRTCQGFWFDGQEHLQLAPDATLNLFGVIHDARGPRKPLPDRLPCPRCDLRLLLTDDRQRATAFRYWRCARGHGRYITFFDFLREKNFVKPLDPQQVAELRQRVQSVACSNCGAPIDLTRQTVCAYCHTPLSMLDYEQVGRTVGELRAAADRAAQPMSGGAEALALALAIEKQKAESAFRGVDDSDWTSVVQSDGLVESGLRAVVEMLRKLS